MNKFSAVLELNLANSSLNVLLDIGASCSLIDIGTLETFGLNDFVVPSQHHLIEASGNDMDIMRCIAVNFQINKNTISHTMQVLNSKTYRKVLLGRDILSKFSTVRFDFRKNRIKLGSTWYNCVTIRENTA